MDTKALRQKILDLAIRGKLVPQDPNDEPASVLLERIRAEKQQMVKDGRLKAKDIKNDSVIFLGEDNLHYEKFADGTVKCIEDEIPFDVPEGWEWCRFSSFASMMNGTSKRTGKDGHATIVLRLADLGENDISYADCRSVPLTEADISKYSLQLNDLLFIRVNGSKANVGKSYLFSERGTAVTYCDHIIRARTIPVILPSLLCNYMRSGYARRIIEERIVSAAGQNTISQPSLSDILIPIPPYDEQLRQMAAIEEALSYIKALENSKGDLSSLIENAKSKILDLAIRGKFVPQNPDDEPASVLLERIRAEKESMIKQGKIKRDKRESVIFRGEDNSYYETIDGLTICVDEDIPFEIPDSWSFARLDTVYMVNPKNDIDDNTPISFVPMSLIDDQYSGKYQCEEKPWKDCKKGFTHFAEGDVGFAKISPCFENRKSAVFTGLKNGCGAGTTELIILRSYCGTILPEYTISFVKSGCFIKRGEGTFSGVVGQQRIDKNTVLSTLVPIPPINEQKRIAARISKTFSALDAILSSIE